MSFSENLKNALSQSNMTMTDLANSTGITYNMIKKYCAGGADPTVSYALKIAETLNVSIDELMDYRAPELYRGFPSCRAQAAEQGSHGGSAY